VTASVVAVPVLEAAGFARTGPVAGSTAAAWQLLVSPRVIRVVHKGMHLQVFMKSFCSIEVLLYSINTVRCSLVLR
jgi:hypothetical protein